MIDQAKRVRPLTMVTAIRPWGQLWLPLFCAAARRFPAITEPLRRLSFIRAAHWTIVRALPDGEGGWQPLNPPQLFFETNYDVDLLSYIETFAQALPWHMRAVWASSSGFPGVFPAEAFYRFVEEHQYDADHYWCAYPDATTRMVENSLQVTTRLRAFEATLPAIEDDERFALEYNRLLIDLQRYL